MIALISLAIALLALSVNLSYLVRRPRIVVQSGTITRDPRAAGGGTGISVIVTGRRRPIEVDQIGVVDMAPPVWPWRHAVEWHDQDLPFRIAMSRGSDWPKRLEDGQSLRLQVDDELMDEVIAEAVAEDESSGSRFRRAVRRSAFMSSQAARCTGPVARSLRTG